MYLVKATASLDPRTASDPQMDRASSDSDTQNMLSRIDLQLVRNTERGQCPSDERGAPLVTTLTGIGRPSYCRYPEPNDTSIPMNN